MYFNNKFSLYIESAILLDDPGLSIQDIGDDKFKFSATYEDSLFCVHQNKITASKDAENLAIDFALFIYNNSGIIKFIDRGGNIYLHISHDILECNLDINEEAKNFLNQVHKTLKLNILF